MSRSKPAPVVYSGLLDKTAPVIKSFGDGAEVSTWMSIIRDGGIPPAHLLDQLEAAGWEHVSIYTVQEIVDERKRNSIGYAAISGTLSRNKGCELEVELTDSVGRTYQVALCRNEYTLLHGHSVNRRGPERRIRLKLASPPAVNGGLLISRPATC